jgi:hypothetical protein
MRLRNAAADRTAVVKAFSTVAAVLLLLVVFVPQPASAAVSEPARRCAPGGSGNVCVTVRTDGTYVRSRVGVEGNGSALICVTGVQLWEYLDDGPYPVASLGQQPCVEDGHRSFYTATVRMYARADYCTFAWYTVWSSTGLNSKDYSLSVCWNRP